VFDGERGGHDRLIIMVMIDRSAWCGSIDHDPPALGKVSTGRIVEDVFFLQNDSPSIDPMGGPFAVDVTLLFENLRSVGYRASPDIETSSDLSVGEFDKTSAESNGFFTEEEKKVGRCFV